MQFFKWIKGRQGSGYEKLTLFYSTKLKIDAYVIILPYGSHVPVHIDPSVEGYEHHRINITIRFPNSGGQTFIFRENWEKAPFLYKFRPDIQKHYVTKVNSGQLWLFSIGWLKINEIQKV